MKRNQNGFSVVEVIMAIAIVVLLGLVGWMYWSNITNHSTNIDKSVAKTQSEEPKTTPQSAAPSTIKTFKLATQPVEFDYPSSWSVKSSRHVGKGTLDAESVIVTSTDGFTINLGTFGSGLGGTGPCDRNITDFKMESDLDSSLNSPDLGVVSYFTNGDFILNIAGKTLDDAQRDCLGYSELVSLAKVITGNENTPLEDGKATTLVFGTDVLFQETRSKTKPSDAVYSEAVAILKSLRKV